MKKISFFILIFLGCFFVAPYTKAQTDSDVKNGLVSHWKFDETSGSTANDSSGNNNGTLSGPTRETSANCKFSNCLSFDGDSYVSTNLDVQPSAMAEATWSVWVYPTRINHTYRQQIMSDDNGDFDRSILIDENSDKFSVFAGTLPNGVWRVATADINQWQHIAVVWKPDNIYFYKNGIEYVYGKAPIGQSTGYKLNIGRNPGFRLEEFQGRIDDVRVYNRALSSDEIKTLYTGSVSVVPPGPQITPGPAVSSSAMDYTKTLIAYVSDSLKLKVMNGEGKNKEILVSLPEGIITDFSWSPDAKKILYHVLPPGSWSYENWFFNFANSQNTRFVLDSENNEGCYVFTLKGDELICRSKTSLFLLNADSSGNKREIYHTNQGDYPHISILGLSPDGEKIYFSVNDSYYWVKKDGSESHQVTYSYLSAESSQVNLAQKLKGRENSSPYLGGEGDEGPAALFADSQGNLQALGIDQAKEKSAQYRWLHLSPDGQKIIYKNQAKDELWIYDLKTGKNENFSSPFSSKPIYPLWSPDGQYITYVGEDGYIELLPSDINERRSEIKNFGTATIILTWPSEGQPAIPVWQPVASQQPTVAAPGADEELQFGFEEDFLKMLDLPLAANDLQNNWQVNDVLWHDVIYEGEAVTLDILLKSKNDNWRLKPGTKVYVSFQLYDKKAPFSLNQVWANLTGEEALLYFKPYIGEVVAGTGPNEIYDIVRVKDVVFSPATFPDMLKVGVAINAKDYGMAYAFGEKEVYVEFSKNAILNCTYGVVDGILAYLSAGAVPALTKTASFLELFKDAFNLTTTIEDRSAKISQFANNQQYIEAGRELAYLVTDIKVALAEDTDPTKIMYTILGYLIKGADCVKIALNLPFMIQRFTEGVLEVFIDKGIEPPNIVFMESPANFLVTTAAGQKIGFDEASNVVNELGENAGVITEHPNTVIFPGIQTFDIVVSGKEQGTYGLTIFQTRNAHESALISYTNVASTPQSKASVKLDPAGQEYLLNTDENNDGTIDSTKKPDKFELIKGVPNQTSKTQSLSQKKSHWLWYLISGVILAVAVIILYKKGVFQKILKKE